MVFFVVCALVYLFISLFVTLSLEYSHVAWYNALIVVNNFMKFI